MGGSSVHIGWTQLWHRCTHLCLHPYHPRLAGPEGTPPALSPGSGPTWPRADGTSQEQLWPLHGQRGPDFAGHCPSSGCPVAAVANDHRLRAFKQERCSSWSPGGSRSPSRRVWAGGSCRVCRGDLADGLCWLLVAAGAPGFAASSPIF